MFWRRTLAIVLFGMQPRRALQRSQPRVAVIEAPARIRFPDIAEVVRHRDLLYFLARKSLALRYKQTVIGVLWVILQPLSMMLVFTLIFGTILNLDSEGMPFPVFVYSGLVAWQYFSGSLAESMGSISRERELMKKVYFPRLVLPLVPLVTHLVDLGISLALLFVLMVTYGIAPSWNLVALPLFVSLLVAFTAGVSIWLSAIHVTYHDIPFAVPFVLQLMFFSSPILYSVSVVHERWTFVYYFNPMSSVIEGFRWTVVGGESPGLALIFSVVAAIVFVVLGLLQFGSQEGDFASKA